jgi:hypothetical protein
MAHRSNLLIMDLPGQIALHLRNFTELQQVDSMNGEKSWQTTDHPSRGLS